MKMLGLLAPLMLSAAPALAQTGFTRSSVTAGNFNILGSTAPAQTVNGQLVVRSTSGIGGHLLLNVRNQAGTSLLSISQAGALSAPNGGITISSLTAEAITAPSNRGVTLSNSSFTVKGLTGGNTILDIQSEPGQIPLLRFSDTVPRATLFWSGTASNVLVIGPSSRGDGIDVNSAHFAIWEPTTVILSSVTILTSATGGLGIGASNLSGGTLMIRSSDTTAAHDTLRVEANNGSVNLVVEEQGRIGIGTASPGSTLHVAGTGLFTSTLSVSGDFSVGGSTTLMTVGGRVGVATASPLTTLDVNGAATLRGATTVSASSLTVNQIRSIVDDAAGGVVSATWDAKWSVVGQNGPTGSGLGIGFDSTNNVGIIQPATPNSAYRGLSLVPQGGNVGIGTNGPATKLHMSSGIFTNDGTSSGMRSSLTAWTGISSATLQADLSVFLGNSPQLLVYSANDAFIDAALVHAEVAATGPALDFVKTRATDGSADTVVASNDDTGVLRFYGSDGASYRQGAEILAEVDGTPGASDMPGRIVLRTTPDGSATPSERIRIDSKGHFEYSGTAPTLSACGTAPSVVGNDNAMRITTGTGASGCTVTFAGAWTNAPICTCNDESAAVTCRATSNSTTAITIAGTGAGEIVDVICMGYR